MLDLQMMEVVRAKFQHSFRFSFEGRQGISILRSSSNKISLEAVEIDLHIG
jgi:hypothetical protein